MKWLFLLCSLIPSLTFGQEVDPRIVNMNGCTGFIMYDHYIVTAKHCGFKSIDIPSRGVKGELVYEAPGEDGPLVFRINKDFPSFKLSQQIPNSGDTVHTKGFPGGNYAITYGKIKSGNGVDRNYVEMRVNPGNSGGPLINENNEVVGVCLSVAQDLQDNISVFTGLKVLREAMFHAGALGPIHANPKGEVVVFGASWCGYCKDANNDLKKELNGKVKITYIEEDNNLWDNHELAKEYTKATGRKISSVPVIWVRGTQQYQVGYNKTKMLSVVGWIANVFKNIGILLFGNNENGEIVEPEQKQDQYEDYSMLPPVPDEPEIDWSAVTIIILAKEQDIGYVKGKGVELAINAAQGPIDRANQEFLDGKAEIFFIPERTEKEKYDAVVSAAKISVDKFYLIVLVQRQDIGLKGLIAGKLEKMVKSKLPDSVPLEVVFDRIHPDYYTKITSALTTVVPQEIKADPVTEKLSLLENGLNVIKNQIPSEVSIAEKINTSINSIKEENKKDNENNSFLQTVIAYIVALLGGERLLSKVRDAFASKVPKTPIPQDQETNNGNT